MTDDKSDRFDELLEDAALTYNRPPDERHIPLDQMWEAIEAEVFPAARRAPRHAQWLRVAAALIVGVGIGRLSLSIGGDRTRPVPTSRDFAQVKSGSSRTIESPAPALDPTTSRYLGQAAALLIALPAETNVGRPDESFIKRANELLLTTRLLLDSQSASDPALRNLLEDLELVLVQIVRLEDERDRARRTELELIQQALDQRDVIPRLRTAASEYAADD
jgi:hypothetical protein